MRLDSLSITNLRAIRHAEITDLADVVVVAGPNGCGKSLTLDAIRLLKSMYGGYQYDEWRHWFGEYQIDLANPGSLRRLLRDSATPLTITASIVLSETERTYIASNATTLLERMVWREVLGRDPEATMARSIAVSTEQRAHGEYVKATVENRRCELEHDLQSNWCELAYILNPDSQTHLQPCMIAEVVFQTYDPQHIGVIDYHSSSRTYAREGLGGINLDVSSYEGQRRDSSLYNWQRKYQNVKTELASTYIREVFAKQANADIPSTDLNETLKDLFQTFFPDKSYDGPRPTAEGKLEFPVTLSSGEMHDIDDLSSGEKEILYGYLRLRNSAPQDSVILLDEPELHLNPGLLQGLVDFYHRHLGRALNNQLWLVTHSDALLRQAVGNQNYSTFHLRVAGATKPSENQALRITASDDLERAIIDLVGDLATYKPNAKVVILEGDPNTEFDVHMVSQLFPDFAQRVNLVSGGGKHRVSDLYATLSDMAGDAGLTERFYAIVDRDSPAHARPEATDVHQWDRYHIENYLLEPKFIAGAMRAVSSTAAVPTEDEIKEQLRTAAATLVSRLVLDQLQEDANRRLIAAIAVRASPDTPSPAEDLIPSIEGSLDRFKAIAREFIDTDVLAKAANEAQRTLEESLTTDEWLAAFPGRLLLSTFVNAHMSGVNYEAFRNLVLDQMVDDRHEPAGMAAVLAVIAA
jgi:AAA domain, putative AbiEii toxin, Type IV TA system